MGEKTRKLVCQPDVAALVPEALARRYEFFPLRCSGGVLKVAVAEPLSAEAHDTLRYVVEREISETLYPAEVIRRSLDGLYGEWVGQKESIYNWREWRETQDDGTIIETGGESYRLREARRRRGSQARRRESPVDAGPTEE